MGCSSSREAEPHNPLAPSRADMTRKTKASLALGRMRGKIEGAFSLSETGYGKRSESSPKGRNQPPPTAAVLHVEYAARTRPTNKDQDCFFVVPHGTHGLTCGITDGHSVHDMHSGRQHAEAAAQHIGSALWKRVRPHIIGVESMRDVDSVRSESADTQTANNIEADLSQTSQDIVDAATECFLSHQERCDKRYRRDIAGAILAKKEVRSAIMFRPIMTLPSSRAKRAATRTRSRALALHIG
jgi:hypothetical protein